MRLLELRSKAETRSVFEEDLVRFQEFALLATMKKNAIIRRYRQEYDGCQAVILKPPADFGVYYDAMSEQNMLRNEFIDDIKNVIDELIDNCYGRESVAYTLMFRMGWAEVLYWIGH